MAVYKVPQDVEADDKLIGPFSFRQFIYLIIVAVAIALAWGLSRLFIPLLIIPLPVIVFFGALALPLRKDQPMEIYMAAIVSFYLKPRKHIWIPDGVQSLVEVIAPKVVEVQRVKDLSQTEAEQRLSYLAQIADTGGWAIRGVGAPSQQYTPMNQDVYFEAQQAPDILDSSNSLGQNIDARLTQSNMQRKQEMIQRMQQPQTWQQQAPVVTPVAPQQMMQPPLQAPMQPQPAQQYYTAPPAPPVVDPYQTIATPQLTYNPYPQMHQSVIAPLSNQPQPAQQLQQPQQPTQVQNPPTSTSEKPLSPDIINLANNTDLSIETIQREADRIAKKEEEGLPKDEVVVSLH